MTELPYGNMNKYKRAKDLYTSPEIFQKLADDKDCTVSACIAQNPSPEHIKKFVEAIDYMEKYHTS